MGPLENLTGKVATFIKAAGHVEWPLPLAWPSDGRELTPARATSEALSPAKFGIRATALHDDRHITAYCLDLPGTLAVDLEAVDATEDEVVGYLRGVLVFLTGRFGQPVCVQPRDRSTAYYWWSLPEGVRLHLITTEPAVATLWITRLAAGQGPFGAAALGEPAALSALAQWIVSDNWAVNLNALLHSAADAGWLRLSDTYDRFFLAGGGQPAAVSHPEGQPLLSAICEPPCITITEPGPGLRLLSVNLPPGAAQGDPLSVLSRLYGAPAFTVPGTDWRCEWRVNDRLLTLADSSGSKVLSVLDDHATRSETLDEEKVLRYLNTLVEELTSAEQAVDSEFIAQIADTFSWVRVERLEAYRDRAVELYAPRTGPWGLPGAVVRYKYGLVEQVFVQGVPQRRTDDGRAQLRQMHERLLGVLTGRYGKPEECEPQEIVGGDRGEKSTYRSHWFYALNHKSIVAIRDAPDQLPISVAYPLSGTPDTWGPAEEAVMLELAESDPEYYEAVLRLIEPLAQPIKAPDGAKHFAMLWVVLLLAALVRVLW